MSSVDRRNFVRSLAALGSGALFAPSLSGLATFSELHGSTLSPEAETLVRQAAQGSGGYGPLVPSTSVPELSIPQGFTLVRLSETTARSQANPRFIVPQAFDGMAAFPLPNGNVRLIRNHEIQDPAAVAKPIGPRPYDRRAGGGTTSLEVRITGSGAGRKVELVAEFVSLSGTHINCAGGPTPWGSWLTCEETTAGAVQGYAREHGYIFEVPAGATGPVDPVPLKAMGRFVHEAIAIDPATGIVYETEDGRFNPANVLVQPGAGLYRFIPNRPGELREGGRLQMLAVKGRPNYNTVWNQRSGLVLPVVWVDILDPDPAHAATDPSAVFRQGHARGGATFQRLEGAWYADASIFFNATSGGDAGAGQVWQYRPLSAGDAKREGAEGQLILVFESPSPAVLNSPDNLCVSPRGGLVICEDTSGVHFIRGLTRAGQIFDFVRTNVELPEFCGACFSPDGEVLFFNTQGSTLTSGTALGGTFAIWGPWSTGAL